MTEQIEDSDLITIAEAARILGVNPMTVRRFVARGDIRAWQIGVPGNGRRLPVRVSAEDVRACIRPIPTTGQLLDVVGAKTRPAKRARA